MLRPSTLCAFIILLLGVLSPCSIARLITTPSGAVIEGVTHVRGSIFLGANVLNGDIYVIDAASKFVGRVVRAPPGRVIAGIYADGKNFVFGAGSGPLFRSLAANLFPDIVLPNITSTLQVYDLRNGEEVASCQVPDGMLVNDVTSDAKYAYFTESVQPFLYRLTLASLPACDVEKIPLPKGIFTSTGGVRANGIAKYAGGLLIANSAKNAVYFVDLRKNNRVTPILPTGSVSTPDGLDLHYKNGKPLLYVAQNSINTIAVYRLMFNHRTRRVSAKLRKSITRPFFAGTTTVAVNRNTMMVANLNVSAIMERGVDTELNVATVRI